MLIDFSTSEVATIKIALRKLSDEMQLKYDPFESIIRKCAKAEADTVNEKLSMI